MDKPKILYVFGGEKSSGAEFVIESLIRNNDRANSTLLMAPGIFFDNLSKESLPYKLYSTKYLGKLNTESSSKLKSALKFFSNIFSVNKEVARLVKKECFSIIHTNTIVPTFYLLPLFIIYRIRRKRIKLVWSDHDLTYVHGLFNRFLNTIVSVYDLTLVVSNAVKEKYGSNPKVKVLYNGLDPSKIIIDDKYRLLFREQYEISSNNLVFGILGQIVDRKGVNNLVNAFLKVCQQDTTFAAHSNLVIGGLPKYDGEPYFQDFKSLIENQDNIKYIGYCSNAKEFYNGIDVLINNSTKEGGEPLGTTIIEGLAFGKIVLASNSGGSNEIIENDISGIVFKEKGGDNEILIEYLKEIFYSKNDFIKMQHNAILKFNKDFLLKEMILNYNNYIKELYE